ncbi:MAG: hypothetical protein GX270_14210 [Clostridiaceae bacterium]|mgnify:CR=1 FL=1|jgi:hypothetical protein|nr:hypothetical protein [Clostridiaceae bacterium]
MKTVLKVFGIIIFVLVVATSVLISQSRSDKKIDMNTPAHTTGNFMLLVRHEKYQDARKLLTSDANKCIPTMT